MFTLKTMFKSPKIRLFGSVRLSLLVEIGVGFQFNNFDRHDFFCCKRSYCCFNRRNTIAAPRLPLIRLLSFQNRFLVFKKQSTMKTAYWKSDYCEELTDNLALSNSN